MHMPTLKTRLADRNPKMTREQTRRRKEQRWSALETQRAGWFTHYQEISDHLLPRAARFFRHKARQTEGRGEYNDIYDNTGTRALRVLGSGMMAGATSPARPWFKLVTEDKELSENHAVRVWLDDVALRMMQAFANSNSYRVLHGMYEELGAFGTAVSILLPDEENIIHLYPVPIGEFALAKDQKGRVDTLYRRFLMTVGELVDEFEIHNVSDTTRILYEDSRFDALIDVMHAIEPRRDRNPEFIDNENMPWGSTYLEMGNQDNNRGILRESGYHRFPVLAPRWAVTAGDVYGHSPGMEALGDIMQLQQMNLRLGQAIDYQTRPPLQLPPDLKDDDREFFPGGINYVNQATAHGGIRPAFEATLDIRGLSEDLLRVQHRIRGSFYADLFLMLAAADKGDRTAFEVLKVDEERLLQLGPTIERLHNEALKPLVEMTFETMSAGNLLPPPPPDLEGHELGVEFVSMLAQAQRSIGMNQVERWMNGMIVVSQSKPEILDKVDVYKFANITAERLGVDTKMLVSDEDAQALADARNKAAAAQAQAEALQTTAGVAESLANTPTEGPNALTETVGAIGGV